MADLAVLSVTGLADMAGLVRAGQAGEEAVVQKPLRHDGLGRKPRDVLERRVSNVMSPASRAGKG